MICEKCKREFPHKKGRFCGTCLPRYADVKVQIKKDCELCGGEGCVDAKRRDEHGQDVFEECPRCQGTGMETEWIWLSEFAELLERKDS